MMALVAPRESSLLRRVWVRVISQVSPGPLFVKAGVSSQSMSTPSNWLSQTNWASLLAVSTGSQPDEVGFSVAPKALTISFTPAAAYLAFRVAWIQALLLPKTPPPMQDMGLLQTNAASTGPPPQVQNARQMQLQGKVTLLRVQPGTARPSAMAAGGHHELKRSMQTKRTGQFTGSTVGAPPGTAVRSLQMWKELAEANRQTQRMAPIIFLIDSNKIRQRIKGFHSEWQQNGKEDCSATLRKESAGQKYFLNLRIKR